MSTAPIYAFLLAVVITPEERAKRMGGIGVGIGIAGVVLLLGVDAGGGTAALMGGAMVALASLGYAAGAFLIKRRITDVPPIVLVTATMAISAVVSLPIAATALPTEAPSLEAVASLFALGVLGTGIAFVFFYDLIETLGPPKASLVAYIAPGLRGALRRGAAGRGRGRGHARRPGADPAGLLPGRLRAAALRQAFTAS